MFSQSTTKFPPPRAVATRRLNSARHITLPCLFVLSLTTVILATIYAVCVGQNNHQRAQLLQPNLNQNTSLSHSTLTNTDKHIMAATNPASLLSRNDSTTNSTRPSTQPQESEVSLLFYSMTLPVSTLIHATTEAVLLKFKPHFLTHTHSKTSRISIPHVLLGAQLLLASGWLITTAFWTHCELSLTHPSVCPVQVRDHLMYGILELSIAKAAVGWTLFAGYLVHLTYLIRWMQVVKRWEGISGWANRLEWEPEDKEGFEDVLEMGDVEVKKGVAVSNVTVVAAAQEARLQKDRQRREEADMYGPPKEVPKFPPPPTKPIK